MSDELLVMIEQNLQRAQRTTQTVPLDRDTLTGAADAIVQLFEDALGGPSVTFLGSASIALDGGALVVAGACAHALLGMQAPAMTATLTTVPDPRGGTGAVVLRLALSVAAQSGWTLATTFPQLASTPLGALLFAGPPTFLLRSFDGPADTYGVLEPAGLNLEATVTVRDAPPLSALEQIPFKLTQTSLAFAGPVTALATQESLLLRTSPLPGAIPFNVSGIAALSLTAPTVVLKGQAAQGEGGIWSSGADVEVWGSAALGGAAVAFGVTPPLGLSPWRLSLVPGLGVRLAQLLGIVPGLAILDALPDAVKGAAGAQVSAFSFLLLDSGGSRAPLALTIAVESAQPWTIVQGILELKRIGVALDVAFPTPSPAQIEGGSVSGTIALGDGGAVELGVSVPIPLTDGVISVWSSPSVALPDLGALTKLLGGTDLAAELPPGLAKVGGFNLNLLSVSFDTSKGTITDVAIALASKPWPIIPGLIVEQLYADVDVANPFSAPAVTGAIGGQFAIGSQVTASLSVQRSAAGEDWRLVADVEDVELPSISDLKELVGLDPGGLLPKSIAQERFTLSELELEVDLSTAKLELLRVAIGASDWAIAPGYFALEQIGGTLTVDWRSGAAVSYGSITAVLVFGQDAAELLLCGEREPGGGWVLSGTLTDKVSLIELVEKALGITPSSDDFGALYLTPVSLTYRTADDSFSFSASAQWTPKIEEVALQLTASVALERSAIPNKSPPQFAYSGSISADLGAHFGSGQLELSVGYVFQGTNKTTSYVFSLTYEQHSLVGTYAKAANSDGIVTVRLGGVTFGAIVTYLVNLVDPAAHFELGSPWDVLNKINFDDLSLVLNLTQRTVGIVYNLKENLGLIDIETIGLTYLHKGGSPSVQVAITGSFLGQRYTSEQPLGWDLLNESPPAPPGQGSQFFDLQDLGVGQHLVLADPKADTMAKVIEDLHDTIVQAKGSPQPWQILKFDPSAGWLVAAKFTVMGMLTLSLVFDDPELYGVEISLAGAKAKSFAGLDFEILYRRLSDTLGVYHVELKLPEVMRHLEFGEVSVTLPVVILDVYTDGSFYIDLGFPYNNDWSVCFGLQIFPFLGAGGFYFGKLSTGAAAGTDLVPRITNGSFGPVIEFGVAIAVGVGKTFSEGPLSAGLSVTVQGIVTGVVSWFNPTDKSQSSVEYYRIEGTVTVVGQLYGTVDFKIISVSVSVIASASVSLTIASYEPILIALSVQVEVKASIKIIFFTIHFSFGLHLNASFTIGSAQATPWQLASGGSGPGPGTTLAARRRVEQAHHAHAAARALLVSAAPAPALKWAPAPVMGATPAPIDVELMPFLTPAGDGTPTVQVVMAPFARTSAPSLPKAPAELCQAVAPGGQDPRDLPFNRIVEALLKWGMQTLIGRHAGPITAVDLRLIYESLCSEQIGRDGFAYGNIAAFLAQNLELVLVPPPAQADAVARAVLPMAPPLQMRPQGQPAVNFWEAPGVDADYQQALQELFAQLEVNYDYYRARDPLADAAPTLAASAEPTLEPITMALFGDWFLMVARAAFQSASNVLGTQSHPPQSADSLASLAATFAAPVLYTVLADDTAASIAALFEITTAELLAANEGVSVTPGAILTVPPVIAEAQYVSVPDDTLDSIHTAWNASSAAIQTANPGVDFDHLQPGTALRIPVAAELFAIADANLDAPLAAGSVPIAGLSCQVRFGDTLGSIAKAFAPLQVSALAEANRDDPSALLAGAPLTLAAQATSPPSIPYKSAAGDTLALVAAFLLVRSGASVEQAFGADPSFNWLINAIPAQNPAADFTKLTPGVRILIPNITLTDKGLQPNGDPIPYTTKSGDTLPLVAACFLIAELRPKDSTLVGIEQQIKALNPNVAWTTPPPPGTALALPPRAHAIAPGETLAGLAARVGLEVSDLASVNASAQVLAPTATLTLPAGLRYALGGGRSLATLAAAVGLTVDALVGRIGAVEGIFATGGKPLTIPGARQADVDGLIGWIVSSGETNNIAGQASSFLMQGLRVPEPTAPTAYEGLYALTLQQFPGPPAAQRYEVRFTVPGGEPWLQPAGYYTPQAGQTLEQIAKALGITVQQIERINPGLDPGNLPAVLLVPQSELDVVLSEEQMRTDWPSTALDPQLSSGYPKALSLMQVRPVRHPVGTPISWAAPAPPALPGAAPPAGGGPALWSLPASLMAQLAADPKPHTYSLMSAPKGQQVDPTEVATYAWATWVPFTVRRVAAAGGGWLEGVYLALGADQAGRDTLLGLWTHLQATGGSATLQLAYQPPSGVGLSTDRLVGDATALIRVNLSTETHSGPLVLAALRGGAPAPAAYATIEQAQQFLRLLWETSVVGTGGFYLTYAAASDAPLPEAVFSGGEDAQLWILALLGEQRATPPDRTLHPFTTGAVVEGNLDPGKLDVFAQSSDGSDTTAVATAPPGNVAFVLERANPSPTNDHPSAEDRTRALYSMLSFTLASDRFETPKLVLPSAPKQPEGDSDGAIWHYDRTIPVFQLAKTPPASLPDALPPAGRDPYAGIQAGSQVKLGLQLRDRFGNELGGDVATVGPIDVGYYDPVIGLSGWPSATGAYRIAGPGGAAALTVTVDLGLGKYVPSPENPFASAVRTAAAHQAIYGQVFYQLRQPDVHCLLRTSLDQPGRAPIDGAAAGGPLERFVSASYVYLGMAQSVEQAELAVPEPGPGPTLAAVAGDYAVSVPQLASANGAADASQLLAGAIEIPRLHTVRPSDTLSAIAGASGLSPVALLEANRDVPLCPDTMLSTTVRTYVVGSGDTLSTIAALQDTTVADLAIANSGTPGLLNPQTLTVDGVALQITSADTFATLAGKLEAHDPTITVAGIGQALANVSSLFVASAKLAIATAPVSPDDTTGARSCKVASGDTLAHIAGSQRATAIGLALANSQTAGILDPKASVDVRGVTVPVGSGGTFVSVTTAVNAQNRAAGVAAIGVAEVALAVQGVPGVLTEGAELTIADYVVQAGDTLASVLAFSPALSLQQIALLDGPAPGNVYAAGTALRIGSSSYAPQPGDTLAVIAAENGLTLDQLAEANGGGALAGGAVVAIPGGVVLGGVRQAPYQVSFGAVSPPTIAAVASTFGTDAGMLGTLNASMPGLLAAGVQIDYPGHPLTTTSTSTLGSLAVEAASDVATFTSDPSVSAHRGLVAAGALFICPSPPVRGRSLNQLAGDLGVSAGSLAAANAALIGLVSPQHVFTVPVPGVTPPVLKTVSSGPNDTLQSLVRRLQEQAPSIALADLAKACGDDPAALTPGAQVLVPPAPATLAAALADPVHVASTFAPLQVTLTIKRDGNLLDPSFAGAAEVVANATAIAPDLGDPPRMASFAAAFEGAFASRRLKLAVGPQSGEGPQRLWVVDFGPSGLAQIALRGERARFYALAPISQALASGALSIQPYDPQTGTLGAAAVQTFASADLDSWMRIALTAIDLVLSPAVAAPAWRLDASAFDAIVASKQAIAGALRTRVAEILVDQSPDPDALAAAQEVLYQGMLVSLATAYGTDAIVQYPVSVDSPFAPANPIAPRLAGKGTARQYQVQKGDRIEALMAYYQVSEEALADALANAQILEPGVEVAYLGGDPYTIAPTDTLATLCRELHAPDVLSLLRGLSLPSGTGLFGSGVRIALGKVARAPGQSDSFASLAAYFEDDPGSLAVANQDRPNVLRAGQTLELDSRSYTVALGDTLLAVAKALQTTPRALATAEGIADRTGLLDTSTTLYDLQTLPAYSLSTAKVSLANGTSYLNLLFATDADATHKSLFLDVGFDAAEIEFQITNVPGAGDYQASEWLRLVLPLGDSAFDGAVDLAAGQTQVPIPLRAFPLLPSVVELDAQPTWPQPQSIAQAKQWHLLAGVQHQSAAQDEIELEVAFGALPGTRSEDAPTALFGALAQFVTAWPALQHDLAALAALPIGVREPRLTSVVQTLATLTGKIATALAAPGARFFADPDGAQRYSFKLEPTIDYEANPPRIALVDLKLLSATDAEVTWPAIYLEDSAGPLRSDAVVGNTKRYYYDPQAPPAFQPLTQRYVFPGTAVSAPNPVGRDAVRFQLGQVSAAVRRNADLLATASTAAEFVYQTPWVAFATPAVPLIETAATISIGTGQDLGGPLSSALLQYLAYAGRELAGPFEIRLLCAYERNLVSATGAPGEAITTSLPVFYIPKWQLRSDGIATLATAAAKQASIWFAQAGIQIHPGDAYVLDLAIFSTADPTLTRPLIETSRLTVAVA